MEYFIGFFVVFLLLIFLCLLFPVRIYISYKKSESETVSTLDVKYMFIKFRLFPDGKPKKEKPQKEKKGFEERKTKLEEYGQIFEGIKDDAVKILDYATSKAMIIEKIGVDVEFGFEDAMHTGIFTGLLNGFVYSVLGVIHHRATLRDMSVNIQPIFGNSCFKTQLDCILRLKNVHIIVVAVNVLKLLRKMKNIKGGR